MGTCLSVALKPSEKAFSGRLKRAPSCARTPQLLHSGRAGSIHPNAPQPPKLRGSRSNREIRLGSLCMRSC